MDKQNKTNVSLSNCHCFSGLCLLLLGGTCVVVLRSPCAILDHDVICPQMTGHLNQFLIDWSTLPLFFFSFYAEQIISNPKKKHKKNIIFPFFRDDKYGNML